MAHRMAINDCENCNEKNICEVQNTMNNFGFRCKMFSPYRPQSNADRIRSMTDEELAKKMSGLESFALTCGGGWPPEKWLGWLREEISE